MRILILHDSLPLPNTSGAAERLLQVIRALGSLGHRVTLATRMGCFSAEMAARVASEVDSLYVGDSAAARDPAEEIGGQWSLEELLETEPFPLVLVTLWFWNGLSVAELYLDRVRRSSPSSVVFCLTDDCHGLRMKRASQATGKFSDEECAVDYEARECRVLANCDGAIVISLNDATYIAGKVPGIALYNASYAVRPRRPLAGFAQRSGVLFLGDFSNRATRDAARWLVESVWPLTRNCLPGVPLVLAGNDSEKSWFPVPPEVERLGRVAHIAQLCDRVKVFASPVLYTTGVPTKSLEAMAAGVALVTTVSGAAALGLVDGVHGRIADARDAVTAAIVDLHRDEKLWEKVTEAARTLVEERYSETELKYAMDAACTAAERMLKERLVAVNAPRFSSPKTLPLLKETFSCYVLRRLTIGRHLLADEQPAQALEQFRFVLPLIEAYAQTWLQLRVVRMMEEAYQRIGNASRHARCEQEAARLKESFALAEAAQ